MKKKKTDKKQVVKKSIWLDRIPIILGIAFALFLSIFCFDVFGGPEPIWMQIVGFLIHLIPVYLLIGALYLSMRNPILGGSFYIFLAIFYIFWVVSKHRPLIGIVMIAGPAILLGILFILRAKRSR